MVWENKLTEFGDRRAGPGLGNRGVGEFSINQPFWQFLCPFPAAKLGLACLYVWVCASFSAGSFAWFWFIASENLPSLAACLTIAFSSVGRNSENLLSLSSTELIQGTMEHGGPIILFACERNAENSLSYPPNFIKTLRKNLHVYFNCCQMKSSD